MRFAPTDFNRATSISVELPAEHGIKDMTQPRISVCEQQKAIDTGVIHIRDNETDEHHTAGAGSLRGCLRGRFGAP